MSKVNQKNLVSYSLLAFCLSFIGLPIYIYLPNYYADNFAVSLKTMAIILLITRLVDTVQDPIFGIISDKFSHLKKKIICYFSPLLGVSFLLLFYPLSSFNIEVWLTIFLIITYSIFSIIYINYQSYAVAFSSDYHLKTKIITYREFFFILGIIFAAAGPAILFNYFSEIGSFFLIGIAYLSLITIFSVIFFFYAPKNTYPVNNKGDLKLILQNQLLRKYFVMFLLNSISSSIPAVLILFFVENIINAKHLIGLFLILYFLGLLLGVMLWTKLSKLLNDKVKTFVISILFTVFIFCWCYFLGEGDVLMYGMICILSGIGFGGDFALAYSILTDIIQKYTLQNNETTIFGVTNFIIKISLTLSSAVLIYFVGVLENDLDNKKQFISYSYALLPIIFRILAAITLHKNFKQHNL